MATTRSVFVLSPLLLSKWETSIPITIFSRLPQTLAKLQTPSFKRIKTDVYKFTEVSSMNTLNTRHLQISKHCSVISTTASSFSGCDILPLEVSFLQKFHHVSLGALQNLRFQVLSQLLRPLTSPFIYPLQAWTVISQTYNCKAFLLFQNILLSGRDKLPDYHFSVASTFLLSSISQATFSNIIFSNRNMISDLFCLFKLFIIFHLPREITNIYAIVLMLSKPQINIHLYTEDAQWVS